MTSQSESTGAPEVERIESEFETDRSTLDKKQEGISQDKKVEESHHVSMGDLLHGSAAQDLTPFERKAALINK